MKKDDSVYLGHMLDIVGMRHKVVHDYLHVDYDLVWDVATRELPPLIDALAKIVPPGVD